MDRLFIGRTIIALGACLALVLAPAVQGRDGSDLSFNQMLRTMSGADTGSQWFDYYVERVNMEIAQKQSIEPYGAAGPAGPVSGFDGYLNNFVPPDTGSSWFNDYVDRVNHDLVEKQLRQF